MKAVAVVFVSLALAGLPAAAAPYPERVQSLYLEGCRKGANDHYRRANRPPDNPAILRACRCTLDQFERAMSIEEFSAALEAQGAGEAADPRALTRLQLVKDQAVRTCSGTP